MTDPSPASRQQPQRPDAGSVGGYEAVATVENTAESVTNCDRCGVTSDECYVLREDCCLGCTHYPPLDAAEDVDDVAILRAVGGDTSIPLNRYEVAETWRQLEAKHLSAAEIAGVLGVTQRSVVRWRTDATRLPYSRPAGGWTMEHNQSITSTTEGATDALLRRAAQSESKRIRNAAERVTDALDRLREAFAEDEGKRAARERVAKLEEELRAAKAALRGGRAVPGKRKSPTFTGEPLTCRKGCGKASPNPQGRAAHERHCTHAA